MPLVLALPTYLLGKLLLVCCAYCFCELLWQLCALSLIDQVMEASQCKDCLATLNKLHWLVLQLLCIGMVRTDRASNCIRVQQQGDVPIHGPLFKVCMDAWAVIGVSLGEPTHFTRWARRLVLSLVRLAVYFYLILQNGRRSNSAIFAQQTASDDMVIAWNEDNCRSLLYTTPTGTPLRNSASNLATSESLFRSVCSRIALKRWTKRGLTNRDYAKIV